MYVENIMFKTHLNILYIDFCMWKISYIEIRREAPKKRKLYIDILADFNDWREAPKKSLYIVYFIFLYIEKNRS